MRWPAIFKIVSRSALAASLAARLQEVARDEPGLGLDASLVDANLARPDDPVDMCLGNALEVAKQKIVESLTRRFAVNRQKSNFCGRGACLRTYNVFHQRGRVSA